MPWFGWGARAAGPRRVVAAAAAITLTASLAGSAGQDPSAGNAPPPLAQAVSVKGLTAAKPHRLRAVGQPGRAFRATATRWPAAASGSAALSPPAPGQTAGPAGRIAGTPVWAQAVAGGTQSDAYQGPSRVSATVLAHARAVTLGVSALVFEIAGDGTAGGNVRVGLDYGSLAQAYGGNYGSRLRLVTLPACALTTPQVPACRKQTPLNSAQDYKAQSVSAMVRLGAHSTAKLTSAARGGLDTAPMASGGRGLLLGATDSTGQEGGVGGDYAAAKLKPSGTWSEAGDSGAFTYTYPITVPSASTRLTPSVSLDYDSQEVDGQTATTQAQSSWLGDGWQTPDSFIALGTIPCDDNPEGSPSPDPTTDECYDGRIVQMSLNGTDTPLVFASSSTSGGVTTSQWRAQADDGAVITHVSDSAHVFGTYSLGNDYWTVTERSGTEYEFGLQHLPGWTNEDPTYSADTMPVYSAHSTDPCYSAPGSVCTMAYEWHLDYVLDTHGEAMAYHYTQTTNYYGEDGGAQDVAYVSDSYLSEIDYGFLNGQAYGTVPDQVLFTAPLRCVAATCGPLSTTNPDVGTQYPDVPADLICAQGATCAAYAPSMFSEVHLASITTKQYNVAAGAYQLIDTYTFTQQTPASGDGLSPTLWLQQIQHTGDDTTAGASTTAPLPVVTFPANTAADLPNRVFTATYPGLYRYRISSIITEMGATIGVSYEIPDPCPSSYASTTSTSVTSANTASCFPVYWTPEGSTTPVLDWFESYAVHQVLTTDNTGQSLPEESDYSYGGGAAWHYDDNQVVKPQYRTWGQFRGYANVTTYTGQPTNDPQTKSITAYYRGMNGDTLPSGTSSVTLTDSQGGTHTDSYQLAGNPVETTTYLGNTTTVESSAITSYWVSAATATMNPAGLPALTANMTEPAEVWTRSALTDGGQSGVWRITETDNSYDSTTTDPDFGLLTYSYSHVDPVNTAYDSCTQEQYAPPNTAENLTGLISYTETDQVACSGYTPGSPTSVPSALNTLGAPASVNRPAQVTKAMQTFYDDPTFSTMFPQATAPTAGNVTMTRQASGYSSGAFTWRTETRDTYDGYGRVEDAYDADGNEAVTSYTVNSAGLTTGIQVAAPSTTYTGSSGTVTTTHVSSGTLDPTRGLTLTSTDQNSVTSAATYDALGRVTAVWKDSRPANDTANITYAYTVSDTSVSGVLTQTLNEEGNQVPSATIYDSLGRVRQTQTFATTPNGTGTLLSDTFYDSRGWVSLTNTNYYDENVTPSVTLQTVATSQLPSLEAQVPDSDEFVYDGTGRQVEDISENDAQPVSTTVTVYNGDSTTTIPAIPGNAASGQIPASAGTVQTIQVNPLGQTTGLLQYTANPSVSIPSNPATGIFSISGGTPDTTGYGYNAQGEQDSQSTGGLTWTQKYNLLGQQTQSIDPSAGTTIMTHDPDGNLLQSQDAEGNYLSFTYDQLGRPTAEYAAPTSGQQAYTSAASPGNQMASRVYDNANNAVQSMQHPDGQATTETSYANGYAYTTQQIGFNVFGESLGEMAEIPSGAPGSAMGLSYLFSYQYLPINGGLLKASYPAAGGLPSETVSYTTTSALDLPDTVGGNNRDAAQTSYTAWNQVEQLTVGAAVTGGLNEALITDTYDKHTGNLTGQLVSRSTTTPADVDNTQYTYTPAGLTTSQTDQRLGSSASTETQCYAYTTQQQLSEAWTATDNCAATPTTTSHATVGDPLGTSSEYFETWGYNPAGQRTTQTALDPATSTFATTTYGYSTTQPTTLTSATTTGATTATSSYGYNADGQQTTRTPAGQTLTWNNASQLTAVTDTATGAQDAAYVYGPDGTLLSQTNGNATTLYLPGEQLTDNNGTITGTRYYTLPGGATAVRTGPGNAYYFEIPADQHGTNTLYLDYTAQNPTWRQYDPYGNPRGPAATWIDNRTFLGDVTDPASSLTDIGARWYDPATGTFASSDPLLNPSSPLQLNGYTYSAGDPVSASDPTGLRQDAMVGGGCLVHCPGGTSQNADTQTSSTSGGFWGDVGDLSGGVVNGIADATVAPLWWLGASMINAMPTGMTPTGQFIYGNQISTTPPWLPIGNPNSGLSKAGYYGWPLLIPPEAAEEAAEEAAAAAARDDPALQPPAPPTEPPASPASPSEAGSPPASQEPSMPTPEAGGGGGIGRPFAPKAIAHAMTDEGMLGRLPPFEENGPTSGIFVDQGSETPLTSGYGGSAASVPRGTPGFNLITRSHVEGQVAAIMRNQGLDEGTLYINNAPCLGVQGCDYLLPRMLPEGSQLRVVAPGFNRTYTGWPDDLVEEP